MDWLYRFTSNPSYPDPVEEIDALCTLDDEGEKAFLLIADRASPPLSSAPSGDVIGLCTDENGRLVLHGIGVVQGTCVRGSTPSSVLSLYGLLLDRCFSPLVNLSRLPSCLLDVAVLSQQDQATFLNGQSFVKRLGKRNSSARVRTNKTKLSPSLPSDEYHFPSLTLPQTDSPFVVVGLDPTAGTWASTMTEGPKEMPSFNLKWDGDSFHPEEEPLHWHSSNSAFWGIVRRSDTTLTCIDGPCATNGPRLSADIKGWVQYGQGGTRQGELELSRAGVNLFWTTQNTVMKFDGASRWIARSLVLFSEEPERKKIETHPHGAFTFLWRMFGKSGTPLKKSQIPGRTARLAILRSFIPGLTESMVPDQDALDAACAAVVAGLHQLGLTKAFGTVKDGGIIWMPDTVRLAKLISANKEA